MKEGDMLTIRVPASSANLGPGFDSIGLALTLYLEVMAERSSSWEVIPETDALEKFPADEKNYICLIASKVAAMYGREMPPCRLRVKTSIPLARGLGSSGAAIVAGVELADKMCGLGLSLEEKLAACTKFEGHPDNVGASLYGGLVVGSQTDEEVQLTAMKQLAVEAVVLIPEEELLTEASRGVLPSSMKYSAAVKSSAAANQLLAAFFTEDWKLAGRMMSSDLFHQPYRKELIPWWDDVERLALHSGAFGMALSGAGPTLLCLAEPRKANMLANVLKGAFPQLKVLHLAIDRTGLMTVEVKAEERNACK
ncbi:homoserine kinase [Bacillus massilinigeriensis]|uniref:homoserine kinase n=1 Tax=Bacillus mediterraneensis TaxID=1805474 RepID=UPI0008F93CC4|nr:homoserine kinase [Bacillus mediterraneensis]